MPESRSVFLQSEEDGAAALPCRLQRRPLSWSALCAGAILTLAVYVTFILMGLASGVVVVDVVIDGIRLDNGATKTFVWTTLSMLAAVFAGGFFAATLCGLSRKADGLMHGLLVWCGSITLFVVIAGSSNSALFGGIFTSFINPLPVSQGYVPSTNYLVNQLRFRVKTSADSRSFVMQNLEYLNALLIARDRMGAIRFMTQVMQVDGTHATHIIDKLLYRYARRYDEALAAVSYKNSGAHLLLHRKQWQYLLPMFFSLLGSLCGGVVGVKRRALRPESFQHHRLGGSQDEGMR